MDVLSFVGILTVYIWVVVPGTEGSPLWRLLFTGTALGLVGISLWRNRVSPKRIGLRLDNLLPALGLYFAVSLTYAGFFLFWHRASIATDVAWPDLPGTLRFVGWAFLQEFLLLAFLLNRLHQILVRERPAILATAAIFAFFHLPNPFLTLWTLGGGAILAWLFLRKPNLLAATLAHATASALVGGLLPGAITGFMRVGPGYFGIG